VSYDFHMIIVGPGEDAEAAVRRAVEREEAAEDEGPGSPVVSADDAERARRVVSALQRHAPALEPFQLDHAKIARSLGVSEDEARRRFQHVELNDDGAGAQVSILGPTANVTVAYCHTGDKAEEVLTRVWGYLRVLQEEGGFAVFDNQLGRALDLDKDFRDVLAAYLGVMKKMPRIIAAW